MELDCNKQISSPAWGWIHKAAFLRRNRWCFTPLQAVEVCYQEAAPGTKMAYNNTNKYDLFTLRGKERWNVICIVVKHNILFRGGLVFPASFDCILYYKASSDIFSRFLKRAYWIYQIWTNEPDVEIRATNLWPRVLSSDRPGCKRRIPLPLSGAVPGSSAFACLSAASPAALCCQAKVLREHQYF